MASVSRLGAWEERASDTADAAAVLAQIRDARVGGSFWLAPLEPDRRPAMVLAPATATQADAMLAALPAGTDAAFVAGAPVPPRCRVPHLAPCDPWSLLDPAVGVQAGADHELAALAWIAGTPLRVHGEGRFGSLAAVTREVVDQTSYRDPFQGTLVAAGSAVAQLAEWRAVIEANRGIAVAAGIARWKRQVMRRFLWAPRPRALQFADRKHSAIGMARAERGAIVAWPSRVSPTLATRAAAAGVPLSWVEDGFLRSVGLGSALHPPLSVVVDRQGIHYDPAQPSDLEELLATAAFPPALLARAQALRSTIVARGVSKYGVTGGPSSAALPDRDAKRRLVLVPGQVSDDLSVSRGGGQVAGAAALLERVRQLEPDAEVWFRPHPDVDAGFRRGRIEDEVALRFADRVVRGGSVAELLGRVDGVHVLTSLAGFEALLRERDVTVHGVPFYAGWGLTRDLPEVPARRGRALTLDQLVAAVLILYPRYLDPVTGLPCTAEVLTGRLANQPQPAATWLTTLRGWQGRIVKSVRASGA